MPDRKDGGAPPVPGDIAPAAMTEYLTDDWAFFVRSSRQYEKFKSPHQAIEVHETAQFGKPTQTRTDDFGGTWSTYSTPLGYVEIGLDRRTSPTGDDDKNPVPGRRSLQAYTDKPPREIFRPPFLSVIRAAEQMTPRADYREFSFFDSNKDLVLFIWLKDGCIDHLELFKHIDR